MPTVYVSADSLDPANHALEKAYFYGGTLPLTAPNPFDTRGDGQQDSLIPATNTRPVFVFGGALYKLLNRQSTNQTIMVKSTNGGAAWTLLDSANSPAFVTCSGYFDSTTGVVTCVYIDNNGAPGNLRLRDFDCNTGLWGIVYPAVGPMSGDPGASIAIIKRPDTTLVCFYETRTGFNIGDPSGIGAVVYDPIGAAWSAAIDLGAALLALPGWDATRTIVQMNGFQVIQDSTGILHCWFVTTSVQVAPVIWGNRVFYQQLLTNNALGHFLDYPGQVAPFPPAPYNTQQLTVFSGAPIGNPIIVGNNIILPVSMRNDSILDEFPHQIPGVYIGTPINNPVWTLSTDTIDPGVIVDDFIWIQEAPTLTYDGTNIYAVYSAQDADGQNQARLRLTQTANLANPTLGWSAQTIFDLQVDAPPGFNFAGQFLSGAGAFSPLVIPPVINIAARINPVSLAVIPLPNPKKC